MPQRESYRLREIRETDLDTILKWRNAKRVRENMFNDHLITMDEHKNWFKKIQFNSDYVYRIFEYEDNPAGLISFSNIDTKDKRCSWGFYLGDLVVPPGSGTVMGFLGLELAFESYDIRKVCSEVFNFNNRSISYHLKLGFVQEGKLIEQNFKNGKYEDVIVFALFKDKWLEKKSKLEKLVFG